MFILINLNNQIKTAQKKVLLCDASFSIVPVLKSIKELGFHVTSCGNREDDPCHALADSSFFINYADQEKVLDYFIKNNFDYIVPGCTDISFSTCSYIGKKLNLPGYDRSDITEIFNDKRKFREYSSLHLFQIPRFTSSKSDLTSFNFPVLKKPIDSFSGRGISKFSSLNEIDSQDDMSSDIYEEFVNGQLFSHSAFIKNEKIIVDFFVEEHCTIYPYQVNTSCITQKLNDITKKNMRDWLESYAKLAHLRDGLIHTQFISDNSNYWLIETSRRCPGDLYSLLIKKSCDVDYAKLFVMPYCGLSYSNEAITKTSNFIIRHTVSASEDKNLFEINIHVPNAGLDYIPIKKSGQLVAKAPFDRAGIAFLKYNSSAELYELINDLYRFFKMA